MSDKHTDALNLNALQKIVDATGENYEWRERWEPQRENFEKAMTPAVVGKLIALARRATEGQAQTSAATGFKLVPYEPTNEQWQAGIDEWNRVHGTTDGEDNLPNVIYRAMLAAAPKPDDDDQDAAQLAESTAPGAPSYDELVSDLKTSRATIRVMTEGRLARDAHIAKLEAAAPTAQQSLTAGGAVPEGYAIVPIEPTEEMIRAVASCRNDEQCCNRWKVYSDNGEINCQECVDEAAEEYRGIVAAAPLPQVQSEAPKARKLVGYAECRCILKQYCDGQCRPIFADQQPVTPSGALADNDGGVAL